MKNLRVSPSPNATLMQEIGLLEGLLKDHEDHGGLHHNPLIRSAVCQLWGLATKLALI